MVIKHLNKNNFQEEVVNSDLPVIIDFWASWCGPCKILSPIFEELNSEYKNRLKFVKANTEEEPEIASRFYVQSIPTLIIINKGHEIDRIIGFSSKTILKQKIESILSKL